MLRYCFLDVDGVLNNDLDISKEFHPNNMVALKKLSDLIDFKIVLSSSWRLDKENSNLVRANLQRIGLDLIDMTPISPKHRNRKDEISHWLFSNEWDSAFILDDLPDIWCDPNIDGVKFFHIDSNTGLTIPKAIEIAEILNAG